MCRCMPTGSSSHTSQGSPRIHLLILRLAAAPWPPCHGRIRPLPVDGSIPAMPGWRWIHTPGHSPGHVSLFRDSDRTLIAGDAFVTTKQESAIAALTNRPEIHGPPAYFTPDWTASRRSVERLAALEP